MSQRVSTTTIVGEKIHTAINKIVDIIKGPELEPAAFVSLGTVVYDDIEYPGSTLIESILGGEGLWGTSIIYVFYLTLTSSALAFWQLLTIGSSHIRSATVQDQGGIEGDQVSPCPWEELPR